MFDQYDERFEKQHEELKKVTNTVSSNNIGKELVNLK